MTPRPPVVLLLAAVVAVAAPACASAQHPAEQESAPAPAAAPDQGTPGSPRMPPEGYGSLTQNDLTLRIVTPEIEVRMVPLDQHVTRLLAPDAYRSLRGLVESRRASIDSIARRSGTSRPGLALVTFFGQQSGIRFDPQTVAVTIRNQYLQPIGIVPYSPRFSSQQLNVREQASAIYLFQEELPVGDSFRFSYGSFNSDDWQSKQRLLDRERARVSARARTNGADSTGATPH
ncbi:MAG TPA: hypothetical protein VJQ44_13335 [Gemmatimonadales bacterium]|nr:hypothetical protein [Gemmatimonadales bacterium]